MSSLYEVPKESVPVEITLINGEALRGEVYLYKDLDAPSGTRPLETLLCVDPDPFLPFKSNSGTYRLINKHQIVFIRTFESDEAIKGRTPWPAKSLVVYFISEQSMYGTIYPTVAEETRVSDIFNSGDLFIAIYHDRQKIVINRNHILYISSN
ncbi:MAG: hypothetical protein OEZ23_10065 [Gammaproteobacteria bacterium]|nr:hypothetical protein [Gammaproteobacteria bacterium]